MLLIPGTHTHMCSRPGFSPASEDAIGECELLKRLERSARRDLEWCCSMLRLWLPWPNRRLAPTVSPRGKRRSDPKPSAPGQRRRRRRSQPRRSLWLAEIFDQIGSLRGNLKERDMLSNRAREKEKEWSERENWRNLWLENFISTNRDRRLSWDDGLYQSDYRKD